MNVVSSLYNKVTNNKYIKFEKQEFDDFIGGLDAQDKEKELTYDNLLKEIKELKSERDYYKNYIEYCKKESNNIGKLIELQDESYRWMETSGYMEHLLKESESENKKLKEENSKLIDENNRMENHIKELEEDLKEYYKIQDKQQEQLEDSLLYGSDSLYYIEKHLPKLYNLIQENTALEDYIKELQQDNLQAMEENLFLKVEIGNTKLENEMYSEKIEELNEQLETKEILDTDKKLDEDYYNTKELDYGLLSNTIDKITDERNTYKEVINCMCDKFNIDHDSVLNILDDISQNKGVEIERV